jgi:hypothetical protein
MVLRSGERLVGGVSVQFSAVQCGAGRDDAVPDSSAELAGLTDAGLGDFDRDQRDRDG